MPAEPEQVPSEQAQKKARSQGGMPLAARVALLVLGVVLIISGIMKIASALHLGGPDDAATQQSAPPAAATALAGEWELVEGEAEGLEASNLEDLKRQGQVVTLTLNEDGTGALLVFSEEATFTWEETGATEATMDWGGGSTIALVNGRLVVTDSTGLSMTFVRAS